MCNETDGKERNECGIGAEGWTIVEDGGLYRAGIECASVEGRHLEKIPTVVRKGSGKIGRTENVFCQVQRPSQDRSRWMRNLLISKDETFTTAKRLYRAFSKRARTRRTNLP